MIKPPLPTVEEHMGRKIPNKSVNADELPTPPGTPKKPTEKDPPAGATTDPKTSSSMG